MRCGRLTLSQASVRKIFNAARHFYIIIAGVTLIAAIIVIVIINAVINHIFITLVPIINFIAAHNSISLTSPQLHRTINE